MFIEPIHIAYCGVTIKVIPVLIRGDVKYKIHLPTRELIIENTFSYFQEKSLWQEVPGGQTMLAEEIGALIEEKLMRLR